MDSLWDKRDCSDWSLGLKITVSASVTLLNTTPELNTPHPSSITALSRQSQTSTNGLALYIIAHSEIDLAKISVLKDLSVKSLQSMV